MSASTRFNVWFTQLKTVQLGLRSSKMACTLYTVPSYQHHYDVLDRYISWNSVQNFIKVLEFVQQFSVPYFFGKESKQMNRFSIENFELSIVFTYRMMRHVCALCEQSGVASTTVEKYVKFRTSSRILFLNKWSTNFDKFILNMWGKAWRH
jgi:hypothetical protein